MDYRKLVISIVAAVAMSGAVHAATVAWGASITNGFSLENGSELAAGNLVRLGVFALSDAQISDAFAAGNVGLLDSSFLEVGSARVGAGLEGLDGHLSAVTNFPNTTPALQMYMWAFDSTDNSSAAASINSAQQIGIFKMDMAINPNWAVPVDIPIPGFGTLDISDLTDLDTSSTLRAGAGIVVGSFPTGASTPTGAPNFGLQNVSGDAIWLGTAANANWIPGTGNANWGLGGNRFPGTTTGRTNTHAATFLTSSSPLISINSTSLNVKNLTFGVSGSEPSSFTIGSPGGNSLFLTSGGAISIPAGTSAGAGHTETVNAPLVLEPTSATTAGDYTFTNSASSANLVLEIGGAVSGGTTTQGIALTLTGTNTGANTVSGAIGNGSAALGLAVTKTGSGRWRLTKANTYTGATTVSGGTLEVAAANALGATSNLTINGGGTLLLSNAGTNDRINDSTTVTLAGGTFNTGGFSETVGALTLNANSVIDMGSSSSILTFLSAGITAWSGTLLIWNWTGTAGTGGGTDQLIFASSANNGSITLSDVQFYSDAGVTQIGFGAGFFSLGSSSELVPIPEPSTAFAGLAFLGLAGWRERRKTLARSRESRLAACGRKV